MTCLLITSTLWAQEVNNYQATTPAKDDAKKKQLEANAYAMLDSLIGDLQNLRLPENRIRGELAAANLFWKKDPARSRVLYKQAATELQALITAAIEDQGDYTDSN